MTTNTADPLAGLASLRAPFPDDEVGKLPRSTCRACSDSPRKRCDQHQWVSNCGLCHGSHSSATMHLDYVGHADVTARLLAVDPEWTWAPFSEAEVLALPPALRTAGLWIHLTVLGVTRPGFGDGKNAKECIGDALRNAAMRFGVALDLWAKGDREWAHTDHQDDVDPPADPAAGAGPARQQDRPPQPPQDRPVPPPVTGGLPPRAESDEDRAMTAELVADLENLAASLAPPRNLEWLTTKWRREHGGLSVEDLSQVAPLVLAEFVDQARSFYVETPST